MIKVVSHPRPNKNKSVVLVGNGPSRYKNGRLIDSFDEVIRFNSYETFGHEEYVGSKTTIWCYSSNNWLLNRGDVQSRKPQMLGSIWVREEKGQRVTLPMMFQAQGAGAHIVKIPVEIKMLARNSVDCFPSTGLVGLLAARHYFGRVCLSNFSGLIGGIYLHYWTSPEQFGANGDPNVHCWAREQLFIKNLGVEFLHGE